jgi:hypothetical protein
MNELLLVLGSACVGFSFAEVSGVPQALSRFLYNQFNIGKKVKGYQYVKVPLRIKPFDCGYCLSFWFGFISALQQTNIVYSLMIGFGASIVAILFKKLL